MITVSTLVEDRPPVVFNLGFVYFGWTTWLSFRDCQGPVGLMSIECRINSSKLSLLLCTSSTGGNMFRAGFAAMLQRSGKWSHREQNVGYAIYINGEKFESKKRLVNMPA